MSISGANGRVWIQPSTAGYDVSLSGESLEKQLYTFMKELFGHECNGYKQTNNNEGTKRQPFWRTSDFKKVRAAVCHYAKTSK